MEFQIIKTKSKKGTPEYSWRIVTPIGDVLARSRKYRSYDDCFTDIDFVTINSFSATVRDLTYEPVILPKFEEE